MLTWLDVYDTLHSQRIEDDQATKQAFEVTMTSRSKTGSVTIPHFSRASPGTRQTRSANSMGDFENGGLPLWLRDTSKRRHSDDPGKIQEFIASAGRRAAVKSAASNRHIEPMNDQPRDPLNIEEDAHKLAHLATAWPGWGMRWTSILGDHYMDPRQ